MHDTWSWKLNGEPRVSSESPSKAAINKFFNAENIIYLHTPPRTPAILQSHRYHHVMPSSSGVFLADAVSSELIVFLF